MQSDMYKDVRKTLLAVMILVPLVPFLASLAIGYSSYRSSMKRAALERAEQSAANHAELIAAFLNERTTDLDVILSTADGNDLAEPGRLKNILSSLQQVSRAFIDLGLINDKGIQIAYAGPYNLTGKQYAETLWFKETRATGTYVSDVFLGYRGKPHFVVAVAGKQNDQTWTLRATVDQDLFGDLVEGVSIGATGEAYIVNRLCMLQTVRHSGGALLEKDTQFDPFAMSEKQGAQPHNDYIYAVAPLNNDMWRLVVRQKTGEALQELDWATLVITLVCLAGGVFIFGLAFMVSGRFVNMLRSKETERHEMEHHLMRAARLAELGEMSAGFAHEINNPLQIMKSEIALMEILAEEAGPGQPIQGKQKAEILEGMEQLKKQIDRCASITRSILKFGRHTGPEISKIDLSVFLPEVCNMIKRKAEVSGIDFSCSVPGDTPIIHNDASQLQQVVLNLINNATQAINERHEQEGGQLKVVAQGDGPDHVHILVQDNGNGIARENLERIFNPFFTTKPPGKGTGLGLSVCHAIVQGMDGSIDVTSSKGEGTVFSIRLPVNR